MNARHLFLIAIVIFSTVLIAQGQNSSGPQLFRIEVAGKTGYIDRSGKIIIPPKFEEANGFSEGLAPAREGKLWGFIDTNGNWQIPPTYERVRWFSNGVVVVREPVEKTSKIIDYTGTTIATGLEGTQGSFREGLLAVQKDNLWGFIDTTGSLAIPFQFDYATYFVDGLANVSKGSRSFYIDRKGKTKLDIDGSNFSEGLAEISKPTGHYTSICGFIDTTGKQVIPYKFREVGYFQNGLAPVRLDNNKWGYIDKTGRMVVEAIYDRAADFSEGMAAVELNGKSGYIDTSGKVAIPLKYDSFEDFSNGLASVKIADTYSYITKTGSVIWPKGPNSNNQTADNLTFCELIKNPEAHDGKEVTVSATVRWSSALQEMYCQGCEDLGRTRIELDESAATPGLKRFKKLFSKRSGTVNATFTGKFSAKGSLSANYTFFVTEVRESEYISGHGEPASRLPEKLQKKICGAAPFISGLPYRNEAQQTPLLTKEGWQPLRLTGWFSQRNLYRTVS